MKAKELAELLMLTPDLEVLLYDWSASTEEETTTMEVTGTIQVGDDWVIVN